MLVCSAYAVESKRLDRYIGQYSIHGLVGFRESNRNPASRACPHTDAALTPRTTRIRSLQILPSASSSQQWGYMPTCLRRGRSRCYSQSQTFRTLIECLIPRRGGAMRINDVSGERTKRKSVDEKIRTCSIEIGLQSRRMSLTA